ncbi:hypothetical protein SAMN04515619_11869 [Collimonas sp. OK412]|nr:hypothetical protein SAMN04515619_11869 [Collimonas sp. OK412]
MLVSVRSLLFRAEELLLTMKVYNLACDQNHRFEGWFASEEDFVTQSAAQQIVCPVCDSFKVGKLPSAPHLNLSAARPNASRPGAARPDAARPDPAGAGEQRQGSPAMAQFQQRLQDMARHVIENTEDVGEGFTEEARRIHYKEVPEHGIRGVASPQQCQELAEEGIEVFQLPLPISHKRTLQ